MASKADFTPEEWKTIVAAAPIAANESQWSHEENEKDVIDGDGDKKQPPTKPEPPQGLKEIPDSVRRRR